AVPIQLPNLMGAITHDLTTGVGFAAPLITALRGVIIRPVAAAGGAVVPFDAEDEAALAILAGVVPGAMGVAVAIPVAAVELLVERLSANEHEAQRFLERTLSIAHHLVVGGGAAVIAGTLDNIRRLMISIVLRGPVALRNEIVRILMNFVPPFQAFISE